MRDLLEDWNRQLYVGWAGARMVSLEEGLSRIELLVADHHRGGAGTPAVNGAILAYLHDIMQGAAVSAAAQGRAVATLSLNISYLSLTAVERVLRGEARVVRQGRTVAFAESEFRNAQGVICCKASGTFRVFSNRSKLHLN